MKYKVTLNGKVYEVEVEKGEAILVDEYTAAAPAPVAAAPVAAPTAPAAPVAAAPATGGEAINAPLPGTVLDVKFSAGQAVKKGDIIVIIEAMKMENEVLAPRDGVVAGVFVQKGSSVDTGAALATLS